MRSIAMSAAGASLFLLGILAISDGRPSAQAQAANTLSIGIVTWIGYGPLFVGDQKGFFKRRGLNLSIKIMDDPGVREAAYAGGQIDLLPNTPDSLLILAANGPDRDLKGRIVLALDESLGADGVVAKSSISKVGDLKGKNVGFQKGITSHFFLLYLLDKAGLGPNDITQVDLDAGAAFVAGRLDAAVTWEPWLSQAKADPQSRLLATSADTPGLLADVLLASNAALAKRALICAFVDGWFESVQFLQTNRSESSDIIARAFKLESKEVMNMLQTTHFFDRDQARNFLSDRNGSMNYFEALRLSGRLFQLASVIREIPDLSKLVDRGFMDGSHCR